jgi:hypothetical protein
MRSVAELRLLHPRFFFDQVDVQLQESVLVVRLGYHFENGPSFETRYRFPEYSEELLSTKNRELIKLWATHLGMVEGMSYWKAACSPKWVINTPGILPEQLSFWEHLIKKGMSEFFFINKVNGWEENFLQFEISESEQETAPQKDEAVHQEKILIPVGGGKDSVVTTELLRNTTLPITTFSVNMYPQLEQVVHTYWESTSKTPNHLIVERHIDTGIMELNKQGYLNGHTPFSAMVAFVSTLTAYLYDYRYVPLSNEWSANEGNTIFLGQPINHQYSKTVEFEEMFRAYQQKYLSTTIEYFSFLRPLHELQISQLFTQYPQYWPKFLSCNRGQKKGVWCGECPKCLFVAVMLSAFISVNEINKIFSKDILNDQALLPIFDELVGFSEVKSLECVGTRDETRAAITLGVGRLNPIPLLLAYGWDRLLKEGHTMEELHQQANALLTNLAPTHFIPEQFFSILQNALTSVQGSHE